MEELITKNVEDFISQITQDETGKRQYYRPIYSIHKWWARRPGALFRSILLLTQENSQNLFAKSNDGDISKESDYYKSHNYENVTIFDPFMGGGTILAEAARLGMNVIGSDLNPVSYWIVRETLKKVDLEKLNFYFIQLEKTAGQKIKELYSTQCSQCGNTDEVLYSFWVRFVNCPVCGERVYLYKRTLLDKGKSRTKKVSSKNPATVFCPNCLQLNEWTDNGDCECHNCEYEFNPRIGTYNMGLFSCLECGERDIPLAHVMKTGEKMGEKLIAIEYYCKKKNDRFYKSPDEYDLEKLNKAIKAFEIEKESLIYPKQEILPGDSSARWRLHNFNYYYEVFNPRQIIAFNYLFEEINNIPEQEYRNVFFTIFSNSLEYNNMMTPYNYPHRKLHHLFNYHALPLTTTPVENSVWGVGNKGAGTFANCYKRYIKAKKYCDSPYDKFKDPYGNIKTIFSERERIGVDFLESFTDLKKKNSNAMIFSKDSSHLPEIPDGSVDFVVTDPPYFDSIHYSELSNFFYVWLAELVDDPNFRKDYVPTDNEAIVNQGMGKNAGDYQEILLSVFTECERILKNDGNLVFTFHHQKWEAWWTLLQAVMGSGFKVVDTFPVLSEYKVNPHIRQKQSLDMDLVLICEKKNYSHEKHSINPIEILDRVIESKSFDNFSASDNKLFLYFMGELLKTASSNGSNVITYDWFEKSLSHFDEYIMKLRD